MYYNDFFDALGLFLGLGLLAIVILAALPIALIVILILFLTRQEGAIKRGELESHANTVIYGKKGVLFLIQLVYNLISMVPILNIIICPVLSLGYSNLLLDVTQNVKPRIGDLFSRTHQLGRAWFLAFQVGIFTFLWSLIPIAGIVLGVMKRLSYSMSFFVLADNPDLTASEALERSKRMMDGHKAELFALELSFIGWWLLSGLTFGILGAVYVNSLWNVTVANFYNALNAGSSGGMATSAGGNAGTVVGGVSGTAGEYKGAFFPLESDEELIIGRDAALCHIVITENSEKISRKHIGVWFDSEENVYVVTDYSSNGTYKADGTRLIANIPVKLKRGQVIYLANKHNVFKLT